MAASKILKGLMDVVDNRTFFHNTDSDVSGLLEARPSRTGEGIFGLENGDAKYGAKSIPFKVRGKVAGNEVDKSLNTKIKEATGLSHLEYDTAADAYTRLKEALPELEVQAIFKDAGYGGFSRKAGKKDIVQAFDSSTIQQMDTPARMARAKEQGYNVDDVTYRWLSKDYPDNKLPTNSRYKFGDAIYSSPEPSYGQAYANEMSSNPVAYPMVARGKIANKDDAIRAEKILIEEGRKPKDYTQTMNAINQQLKTEGFTGLDYAGERMMFDEDTSRSIFAAFDPTKASSSNILASNPAALAGAGILGLGAAAQSNDTYADYSPSNLAKLRNDDVGGYQAPQSMAAANIAGLMGDANKVGYDDPLMGMVAPQLPSELMNKIAYNDERGLLDYAKAYAGLLGF